MGGEREILLSSASPSISFWLCNVNLDKRRGSAGRSVALMN